MIAFSPSNNSNPIQDNSFTSEENLDKLIDESFRQLHNTDNARPGSLVQGKVLSITKEDIFLDIGVKSQGIVPLSEFPTSEIPNVGDSIEVVIVRKNIDGVLLSHVKAKEHKTLENLRYAFKHQIPVQAKIIEIIPGGFSAEINKSFKAFVPISQIDSILVTEENAKNYVGNTYEFIIQNLFKNRYPNPTLSRKQLLTSQALIARESFFQEKHIGDVVEGVVKNHASFGIFVDLGGFDGLLHQSDISWTKYSKPSEYAEIGQKIQVKIVNIDYENKKINLSLKAMTPDPWESIEEKYSKGDMVKGKVIKVVSYGAFIDIEEGITGFVHVSEMSWARMVHHPKEIVTLHSFVECKVLSIDKEHKRISLGIKQVHKNPWDTIESIYPVGLKITLPVKKVIKGGTIVEFPEGFTGFIPGSEYTWKKEHANPTKVGMQVESKIIGYKRERNEITLSIKQLTANPYDNFTKNTVIEGEITSVTDFGVFVKFYDDVEGFIPRSLCFDPHEHGSFEEVRSKFKKGEKIQALIKEIQAHSQKIVLSIRDIKEISTKKEFEKHMISHDGNHHVFSIGDAIKDNTNSKL